jgi:hypothetical protein
MEGTKEAKLSWGSKAHDEGIKRLLCDSGVSAGERPEHRKGSDAALVSTQRADTQEP